jgi:hypothetical protein
VDATGIAVPMGSPDLADREQHMVVVSSEVVTAWTTEVRIQIKLSSSEGKEHYQVSYARSTSGQYRLRWCMDKKQCGGWGRLALKGALVPQVRCARTCACGGGGPEKS